jgi:cytochrome c oxidase cbb3-type subunit 3
VSREIPELPRSDEPIRDGIGEDDNKVPLWFNVGFYGMLVVGVIYILVFTLGSWSQVTRYEAEVAAAEQQAAVVRAEMPTTNPYTRDDAAIAEGQQLFATTCAVCHKPDGSGMVGPSLVDPYWKYGDDDSAKFVSVDAGRPLGMPPWGTQLGADKIWKILAFVDTLPTSEEPGVGSPEHDAAKGG